MNDPDRTNDTTHAANTDRENGYGVEPDAPIPIDCAACHVHLGTHPDGGTVYQPSGVHVFERSADRRMAVLLTDHEHPGLEPSVVFLDSRHTGLNLNTGDHVCNACVSRFRREGVVRDLREDDFDVDGELPAMVACRTCGAARTGFNNIIDRDQAFGVASEADTGGVSGAYGSRHDDRRYAWANNVLPEYVHYGVICDACVDHLLANGYLVGPT